MWQPPTVTDLGAALVVLQAARLGMDQLEAKLLGAVQEAGLDWAQIAAVLEPPDAAPAQETVRETAAPGDTPVDQVPPAEGGDAFGSRDAAVGSGSPRAATDPRVPLVFTEAYRHAEPLGAVTSIRQVFDIAGLPPDGPGGAIGDDGGGVRLRRELSPITGCGQMSPVASHQTGGRTSHVSRGRAGGEGRGRAGLCRRVVERDTPRDGRPRPGPVHATGRPGMAADGRPARTASAPALANSTIWTP
ncbi:hypothetical protein ETD83_26480 [Actinomadura soli]|uniref:Uncharacterized protein n=1 Tax=Actinomadura soli TaxID=2508997 RepID=A0A5C4J714_9ACTN|nr:hypothetical protein [Actinomadura soli]TMQ92903.1 hypothetical protein ETD83_26480 [Actinomadura soli]